MLKHLIIISFLLSFSPSAFAGFEEGRKAYDKKDWKAAITELRPLAERGDDRAMILLGNMYADGYGVAPDRTEALKLYKRAAAEKDNTQAMNAVGAAYVSATGVDQNLQTALEWFLRSARLGDQIGAFFYASILAEGNKTKPNEIKPDHYTAYKWFRIAAAKDQNKVFQSYAGKIAQGIVAKKLLTPEQVTKADAEAADWKPVDPAELGPIPADPPQKPRKDKPEKKPLPDKKKLSKDAPKQEASDNPLPHSEPQKK